MTLLTRFLPYILAAFMAMMGVMKFVGDVPIFLEIETNLQADYGLSLGFIDPVFKYVTGVLELAAAALLVFGKRLEGAALSVLVIAGAVVAHLTVLGIATPVSAEPGAETSPMLFVMALVGLALAIATFFLVKREN